MKAEPSGVSAPSHTRFRRLRELGRGASAVVDLAHDEVRGESVALKRMRQLNAETRFRLKEEFRRVQGVRHASLVRLHDLFVDDVDSFFTMEPIFGQELGQALAEPSVHADPHELGNVALVLNWLRQLAEAVSALHAAGLVHRDIKPSNVLVESSGRVVLLDYGFCSPLEDNLREQENRAVVGTMPYMSPERLWGGAPTPESDWYSLGVLAAELLCGRQLFTGPLQDVLRQKDRPPQSFRAECPHLPEAVDELVCRLLRRSPQERPDAAEILRTIDGVLGGASPISHARPTMPHLFLGRRSELERVDRWLTSEHKARVLRISGPSGIGKTSLAREVVQRIASGTGWLVLKGRCHPKESVPLKALDAIIDELTRYLKALSARELAPVTMLAGLPALCSLFPVLRRVEAIESRIAFEPEVLDLQQRWLVGLRAFRGLLGILSSFVRVVVWIDDLQWADRDGMKLLSEAIAVQPRSPTTWVFSLRHDEESHATLAVEALKRELFDDFFDLKLEGLQPTDAAELVLRLGASPRLVQAVVGEALGSPFIIGELTRHALGSGGQVLATVERVVAERLQALGVPETEVLQHLALLESPVTIPTLQRLTEGLPALPQTLHALEQASLIRVSFRGESADPAVEIFHDRIRETVSARMSPEARRQGHRSLAEVLMLSPDVSHSTVAFHLRQAGDEERALSFTLKAAAECTANMAFEQAASLYEDALRLLGQGATPEMVELHAEALLKAGRCTDAGTAFLEACRLAGASGERAAYARALKLRAGGCFMDAGRIEEGRRALDEVLLEHGRRRPRWPMAEAILARTRFMMRGTAFKPTSEVSAERAERFDVLWAAAKGTVMVEHIAGDAMAVQALLEGLRLGDRSRIIQALGHEAASEANIGGPAMLRRAAGFLAEMDALVEATGRAYDRAWWHHVGGAVAWFAGDWALAEQRLREALHDYHLHCTGAAHESNVAALFLLSTLEQRGRFLELGSLLQELRSRVDHTGDVYAAVAFRTGPCVLAPLAEDKPDVAEQMCEEARLKWQAPTFTSLHFQHFIAAMHVNLYRGDTEAGWQLVEQTWPDLERGAFLKLDLLGILLRYIRARAALQAASASSAQRAKSLLAVAEDEAKKIGKSRQPHAQAWRFSIAAGISMLRGRRDEAATLCAQAAELYTARGMVAAASVARLRRAQLERDDAEERESRASLRSAGVRNPDAMARLLMPIISS